jgi:hypothetical protein
MKPRHALPWLMAAALGASALAGTRGADQLFWCPTVEQALERAAATGRPIFMLFYTCVDERAETYSGNTTVW